VVCRGTPRRAGPLSFAACRRLATTLMTLRATAPAPLASRALAPWVGRFAYDRDEFFRADGADAEHARRRSESMARLLPLLETGYYIAGGHLER